jgi:1-deoxy-D-xylulose-5-phosphate reductoisomerase
MVEFTDGIILAQMSVPDMRIPLYYALSYPDRFETSMRGVDFFKTGAFHFDRPDLKKFPCLALAKQAALTGGTMPSAANAANEIAVAAYLAKQVDFGDIPRIIGRVMRSHTSVARPRLDDILEADQEARTRALELVGRLAKTEGRIC